MSKAERPSEMKAQAGLRLRAARQVLDVTQEGLAHALGCARTALANWETGERLPDVAAMVRLYQRSGITLEWIYAGSIKELPYDKAEALVAAARQLGAVVGGPVVEWPMAVAREPGLSGMREPAAPPSRRPSSGGMLHERETS